MIDDANKPTTADVNILLIDDPVIPSRETMDDDKMYELVDSVKAVGFINPLVVEPEGDRYRLMAGHRRLTAARILNLETVPARIYPAGTTPADVIQTHENSRREDVNPGEEAERFDRLYRERCGEDVDRLCALVGESREYVERRLLLKRGDPDVFAAVKAGGINLTAGVYLNKIQRRENRLYYLDAAVKGGVSAKVVRDWVVQAEHLERAQANGEQGGTEPAPVVVTGTVTEWTCPCCLDDKEPYNTVWVQIHRACWDAIILPWLGRYQQAIGFTRDADERKAG